MAVEEQQLEKWKKAYRVLDLPATASALAIKSNYRKLIKRWHPDRPATGASTAADAAMMTRLINEAYETVKNAPLRYYSGSQANESGGKKPAAREKHGVEWREDSEVFLIEKRVEYAVRIICGVLSGAFLGLIFAVDIFQSNIEFLSAAAICAVGFAAGAVKYGDKFWRVVFGKWWMWE